MYMTFRLLVKNNALLSVIVFWRDVAATTNAHADLEWGLVALAAPAVRSPPANAILLTSGGSPQDGDGHQKDV
jgi:hypothetical protein